MTGLPHYLPILRRALPWSGAVWKADHQELLNAYFQARAVRWKDVYESKGLMATIYRARRDAVLRHADLLRLPRGSQILDAGCGAGLIAVALALRGHEVHAVDTVPSMIEQTRQRALAEGVQQNVRVRLDDVRHLSFENDRFDLAVSVGVIPWVDDPLQSLRELARVMKPGGHLILAVDNKRRLNNVLDPWRLPSLGPLRRRIGKAFEKIGYRPEVSNPRASFHSIKETDAMLSMAGLIKVEGKTLGFGPFTFLNRALFSDRGGDRCAFQDAGLG